MEREIKTVELSEVFRHVWEFGRLYSSFSLQFEYFHNYSWKKRLVVIVSFYNEEEEKAFRPQACRRT